MAADSARDADAGRLESDWRAALLAKDAEQLRAIMHPQFELLAMRGHQPIRADREAWLTALGGLDIEALETRLVRQTVLDQTIVATMDAQWKVRYLGQHIAERVMVTDVWVNEDGRWQVIRRHSSVVPASAEIG